MTIVFAKAEIILILSTTKKQGSYGFAPDLEIYMLMVSTLAFALFKDLEPLFFHDQRSFLQVKIFFHQGSFPQKKIFP